MRLIITQLDMITFYPLFMQGSLKKRKLSPPNHIHTVTNIHTWRFHSTTTHWSAGHRAARLEQFGFAQGHLSGGNEGEASAAFSVGGGGSKPTTLWPQACFSNL